MTSPTPDDPIELIPPTAEEIARLSAENDAAINALAAQGVKISMADVLNVRVQLLTEVLLGPLDDPRRLAYEYRAQTMFAQAIADIRSQVTRAQLLQGVNVRDVRPPR